MELKDMRDWVDNIPEIFWEKYKKEQEQLEIEKQKIYNNMDQITNRICSFCDQGHAIDNKMILYDDEIKKVCSEIELSYFIDYYFDKAIESGAEIETGEDFGEQEVIITYNCNRYYLNRIFGQGTAEFVGKIDENKYDWKERLNTINKKIEDKSTEIERLKEKINVLGKQIDYLKNNELIEAQGYFQFQEKIHLNIRKVNENE